MRKRIIRVYKKPNDPNVVYCNFKTCPQECNGKEYPDNGALFRGRVNKIPFMYKQAVHTALQYTLDPEQHEIDITPLVGAVIIEAGRRGLDPTQFGITWTVKSSASEPTGYSIDSVMQPVKHYCDSHIPDTVIAMKHVINKLVSAHSSSVFSYTTEQRITPVDLSCELLGCSYENFLTYLLTHTVTDPPVTPHAYVSGACILIAKCLPNRYDLSTIEGQYAAFHFSNYAFIWAKGASVRWHIKCIMDTDVSALGVTYDDYIDECPSSSMLECLVEQSSRTSTSTGQTSTIVLMGDKPAGIYLEGEHTKKHKKKSGSKKKKSKKGHVMQVETESMKKDTDHRKKKSRKDRDNSNETESRKKSRKEEKSERRQRREELIYNAPFVYPEIAPKKKHRHSR